MQKAGRKTGEKTEMAVRHALGYKQVGGEADGAADGRTVTLALRARAPKPSARPDKQSGQTEIKGGDGAGVRR